MQAHTYAWRGFLVGVLSLWATQASVLSHQAWAAEGHDNSRAQGGMYALEASIPDGVIGVALHVGAERVGDPSVLFIAQVLPDGPAEKAGIKQGDQLITVDGAALTGKTYEEVALMVRGEPGTVVKLGVKSEGGVRDVSVTRVAGQTLYKGQMGSHGGQTK